METLCFLCRRNWSINSEFLNYLAKTNTPYRSQDIIVFFKLAIPGLFLLYFRLFNTVDSKQMFDKSLPMTGFEQQISGVGGDRSTNWATTTTAPNIFTSFLACKTDFKTDVHRRPSYWKNFFTFNLRSTGVNAISKFMRRIAMLPRNRALWLAIPTTMTFSNQSEGFISA